MSTLSCAVDCMDARVAQTPSSADLFAAYAGRVAAFVRRRVGDGPHVDDIVQETFLTAHRELSRFRGDAQHSTWLMGIANNFFGGTSAAARASSACWRGSPGVTSHRRRRTLTR